MAHHAAALVEGADRCCNIALAFGLLDKEAVPGTRHGRTDGYVRREMERYQAYAIEALETGYGRSQMVEVI
jgi:hypothetical protein